LLHVPHLPDTGRCVFIEHGTGYLKHTAHILKPFHTTVIRGHFILGEIDSLELVRYHQTDGISTPRFCTEQERKASYKHPAFCPQALQTSTIFIIIAPVPSKHPD
jgi:hypothetical protein